MSPAVAVAATADTKALWFLTRGGGVVALLLLTASVLSGLAAAYEWAPAALPRFVVPRLHRNVSLLVLVFLAVHVASTVVDGYAPVGWLDALVPFGSAYHPLALGLGALAVDLLLAVVVTSMLRHRIGRRAWRAVHWASYAAWAIGLLHGLLLGTDRGTAWLRVIEAVCAASVAAVALARLVAPPRAGARLGDAPIGAAAVVRPRQTRRHRRSPARPSTVTRSGTAGSGPNNTVARPTATAAAPGVRPPSTTRPR